MSHTTLQRCLVAAAATVTLALVSNEAISIEVVKSAQKPASQTSGTPASSADRLAFSDAEISLFDCPYPPRCED